MKYPGKYAQKDCWTIFFDGGSISTSAWKVSIFRVFSVSIFRLNIDFQTGFVKFPNKNLFTSHMYPADTDIFKTFSGRLIMVTTLTTKQDVVTTSEKRHRICDVLKTSDLRRLENVQLTTSWRRLIYDVIRTSGLQCSEDVWFTSSWRRPIWDVLKMSDLQRLQDVWFTTSWRRLIYVVLKTSNLRRLENVWFTTSSGRLIYDVLKTSNLPRHEHVHSRCLEDVWFMTSWRCLIYDVLKTSVKRRLCSNFVATSLQRRKKWFFFILYCLKYSENFIFSSLG